MTYKQAITDDFRPAIDSTISRYRRWATEQHLLDGPLPSVGELEARLHATLPAQLPPQQTSSVAASSHDYETLKQKRKFTVYAALVGACQERGVDVSTYKTFVKAANRRPSQERVAKRQGMRAAAQAAPFWWELSPTTPRHGDRPLELAHLDHTQLDVELVCSRTGRNLGRPWATFLSDAFARRLLAVCLAFDSPSYRACMLALRECVRRYQRLPEAVVVDSGPDFESVYFETLLAQYACAKKTRPAGRPRFGLVCERLFGTTNTRFVHTPAIPKSCGKGIS